MGTDYNSCSLLKSRHHETVSDFSMCKEAVIIDFMPIVNVLATDDLALNVLELLGKPVELYLPLQSC